MSFVRRVCAAALVLGSALSAPAQARAEARTALSKDGSTLRLTTDAKLPTQLCIRIDGDERTRTIELSLTPMDSASSSTGAAQPAPVLVQPEQAEPTPTPLRSPARPRPSASAAGRIEETAWTRRISAPTYGLAAGALALLGTGVALGVRGRRELDRLNVRCAVEDCDRGDAARGRRLYLTADVALGVSAGFVVATLWSYFAHDSDREQRSSTRRVARPTRYLPSVSLTPQRAALAWSTSF